MNNPVESVWDYPRPPQLEPTGRRIRLRYRGESLADTRDALRVLETSHPPVYYLPLHCLAPALLERSHSRSTWCEFKGAATYWNLVLPGSQEVLRDAAWSYEQPAPRFAALSGYPAFYASRLAAQGVECWVDEERIEPQPGDFYGGWITSELRGPFKGVPGSRGW